MDALAVLEQASWVDEVENATSPTLEKNGWRGVHLATAEDDGFDKRFVVVDRTAVWGPFGCCAKGIRDEVSSGVGRQVETTISVDEVRWEAEIWNKTNNWENEMVHETLPMGLLSVEMITIHDEEVHSKYRMKTRDINVDSSQQCVRNNTFYHYLT